MGPRSDHTVIIGSRELKKAETKAKEYRRELQERSIDADVHAQENETAAENASVVVVIIPSEHATSTVKSITPLLSDDQILVNPAVGMRQDTAGFHYDAPEAGSITEEIEKVASDRVPVIVAFQNFAAGALSDLDDDLKTDVILTGTRQQRNTRSKRWPRSAQPRGAIRITTSEGLRTLPCPFHATSAAPPSYPRRWR